MARVGGIFLRTKSKTPVTPKSKPAKYKFFHSNTRSSSVIDTCDQITNDFLQGHSNHANAQSLDGIEHVIIYLNGKLSLWQKGTDEKLYRVETIVTPAIKSSYKLYKSLSHLSVWVDLVLQSIIDNNEKTSGHDLELSNIKSLLIKLYSLNNKYVKNELLFKEILLNIIDKALSGESTGHYSCLKAQLLNDVKGINVNYATRATTLQLKGLHKIVSLWITEWNLSLENSRVLLVVPQGPRDELIEKQYFLDLFNKQGIGEAENKTGHIVCVEMLPEQMASVKQSSIISFLKRQQLNIRIGQNMLGDSEAMKKDILSQYAPPVLEQLCPLGYRTDLVRNSIFKNVQPEDKAQEISTDRNVLVIE